VAEEAMPEIDASYIDKFMKEIGQISEINTRSTQHLDDKQNETYLKYNQENMPTAPHHQNPESPPRQL
jgi:hypothetical protein